MPATLRIFRPQEEPQAGQPARPPQAGPAVGTAWTLRDFATFYFRPAVLTATDARPETCRAYRDALTYWQHLTGDPPLSAIDSLTVAQFADRLRTAAPLRRRALPGSAGQLAPATQHRILRTLRALLRAAGPAFGHSRPAANLVPALFVPLPRLRPTPAAAPSLAALRLAFGAAAAPLRGLIAVLFYTGLRPGAALAMTCQEADLTAGRWHVTAETNAKTHKPYAAPMHPAARRALLELHPADKPTDPAGRLLPWPYSAATLRNRWRDTLTAAGLAPFRLRDIRRTHAAQIAATGIDAATAAAQQALQHHAGRTTTDHYLSLPALLVSLPDLYEGA